ncbi:MAG: 3-phosphoglycerate dehydrogenase, partial [Clostridia bacterium]|nr:3-phosphoglycerate dehydrogenase [Clostridia bacterium]
FGGCEIAGKTLGIIGLGAIGRLVAEAAGALGMHVVGCGPFLSPERRDALPPMDVVNTFDEVFAAADYLTLHVPATPDTKGLISSASIAKMKPGVRLLNLARADLAVAADVKEALAAGKVAVYVTDFPTEETVGVPGIIAIPHLGASTEESEDNCAVMAAGELRDYLENGTIRCSVNFPVAEAPRKGGRIVVLGRAGTALGEKVGSAVKATVTSFEGKTTAVVYADYDGEIPEGDAEALAAIDSAVRIRELS